MFVMPFLPAFLAKYLPDGLELVSDLCLMPIVFSNLVIFSLMRFRKLGLS
jgi:hypothetical protein